MILRLASIAIAVSLLMYSACIITGSEAGDEQRALFMCTCGEVYMMTFNEVTGEIEIIHIEGAGEMPMPRLDENGFPMEFIL